MNNQITWSDDFNIGVDIIDKEHKRLFKIINKLFAFSDDDKKSQWACQEGIKFFKEHATKHFADEENYMASINYENLNTHRHVHQSFQNHTLPALEKELEQTNYSSDAVDHFLGVCAGWLIGHTLTEDQAITGKSITKWVNLLPEDEHEAMKKVIIQLIYDMFHLESHVVSDTYGGEKFGRGVYYRLVYNAPEDMKWEVFLVFEENLLINTVGKIMGIRTNKLDTMLINAARYTSQQFVGRVKEHLPDAELYNLVEENLLTYEEFQKVFSKESMQFSLLLDTGAGYFSFCVIAPHLLENGIGTPLQPENAMDEVREYLSKKETPKKKSILIVDDSLTVRHAMKDLLDENYDVTLAQSGASAIRSITLNRPDLVLLDYEMPVIDGKQVLQMIRSEEELTNIPVFFLTGRIDHDSVKNVISLKPEGYLSKNLKPVEIKEKIDRYFEHRNK